MEVSGWKQSLTTSESEDDELDCTPRIRCGAIDDELDCIPLDILCGAVDDEPDCIPRTTPEYDVMDDIPDCSPCEKGGSLIKAHGFCSNCKEHLCEGCYKSHLHLRLFENHVLLDKSKMPREVPPFDDMCTKHPGQQLEYFRKNDDRLECSKCVNNHPRKLEDVSYIPYICDDIEETEEFKTLGQTLTNIDQDVMQTKAKATTNLKDIQTNVNETLLSIHWFRKYVEERLNSMEEKLCEEINRLGTNVKETIETVSDDCNTLTSNIRAVIDSLDVSRKTQQKMSTFVTMKNAQRILPVWQRQLHDIVSNNKIQQYKFEPERRLQDMIGHGQTLGRLVMEDNTVQPPDPGVKRKVDAKRKKQTARMRPVEKRSVHSPANETRISTKNRLNPPQNLTTTKDCRVDVTKQPDEKDCWITQSVLVGGNMLAVADYWNKSLKLVHMNQKKLIDRLSITHAPWDITRVKEHTLAVTCPVGGYIQLVKVSSFGTLILDQQIPIEKSCNGIRYLDTNDGRLVVSFIDEPKIQVMDMSGTVLKDLSSDAAGQPRFSTPYHITVSNDGSTLIVSNAGNNTVTRLTLDGEEKFVYKDTELQEPRGVAVGDGGEIYICGSGSHNIHVVSSEGRKIKVLLNENDGVKWPESITYSENKLFVGSDNYNYVDVYKVQYL